MNAQLAQVRRELEEAREAVGSLAASLTDQQWEKRPPSGGWAVAHCVMHLNVTTTEFLPRLDEAIRSGQERNLRGPGPFRQNLLGWMLCKFIEPPYRMKARTPPKFDPQEADSKAQALADWDRLQGELYRRIDAADGLALNKLRVVSPFAEKLKYDLLIAMMIIPIHQRRHIWQAQQILSQLR